VVEDVAPVRRGVRLSARDGGGLAQSREARDVGKRRDRYRVGRSFRLS